uniref:Chibby family member 1, beta catenin antagonist n=1 Tax=Erpetoichthys calabaricus TaxID=27687 RepID=A0A8C4S9V9_ERPCA
MPLLGSIFSLKKFSPRKSASLSNIPMLERSVKKTELGLEYGAPFINIGGHVLKFEDGQWVAGESKGVQVEMQRLKQRSQKLEEENNFLKLKVDILLDMSICNKHKFSMSLNSVQIYFINLLLSTHMHS